MAAGGLKTIEVAWTRCYGRDGRALPTELSDKGGMAEEAINVGLNLDGLPTKRSGSKLYSTISPLGKLAQYIGTTTGGTNAGTGEHLVAATRDTPPRILVSFLGDPAQGGRLLTVPDPIADIRTMSFAQLNDKLFIAYDSGVNRLHVWDPKETGDTVRRVGLGRPAAPTAANAGSGTYAAVARFYRIRWLAMNAAGTRTLRTSELGASVSFTPSGSGASVAVTRPAAPTTGEPVTHWQVLGSIDDAAYYVLTPPIPIATTSYSDTVPPANYADGDAADLVGLYTPWPSVKYLLAGIDRLIGLGAWEHESNTGEGMPPVPGRVYFSRTINSTSTDDDESVSNALDLKGYLDVGRGLGYADRGLGGPIDGQILVFQDRGIYVLHPTGDAEAPFRRVTISLEIGAIEDSIFNGQDELGRPCCYFADETAGVYRYGAEGLQWCGMDSRDVWATFNRTAPDGARCHGCFHNETQSARFWVSVNNDQMPSVILKFSARLGRPQGPTGVRYGWSIETGRFALARDSLVTRAPAGDVARKFYTPWVTTEAPDPPGVLFMDDSATGDYTTPFAGSVKSKPLPLDPIYVNKNLVVDFMYLQASALAATIRCTLHRNYGQDATAPFVEVTIAGAGAQTRVVRRFEGARIDDAWALQITLGDPAPALGKWTLDAWLARLEVGNQEMGNRG